MEERSKNLQQQQQRHVKCILAAGLSHQEAYALKEEEHSIFTKYLLKGLKGEDNESIDNEGNVTPQSLSNYVYIAIKRLPSNERPHQDPIIITEGSANIILASYPDKRQKPKDIVSAPEGILASKSKILIGVGIAAAVAVVLTLALSNYYNHSSTTIKASPGLQISLNKKHTLFDRGLILSLVGDYTGAIKDYDKALAIDPKYEDALNYKGDALNSLGDYTQAIEFYDKTLAINPKNVAALTAKALTLSSLGNYTQAIRYLDKALTVEPHNESSSIQYFKGVILRNKGSALDNLENHTGAIEYFDKALAIDPHDVNALTNKGWALIKLGNYTGAITYFNKALAIDPNYKLALNTKAWALKQLHTHQNLH